MRDELASDSYELAFEEPTPPDYNVHAPLTAVGIFLAGAATTTLLNTALKDAYDGAKRWLKSRFEKDKDADAVVVTIYGPNGRPLKNVLGRPPNIIKDLDDYAERDRDS
ncbi:hypothetical protein [Mycolicibacterium sp. YH-1]|uniref:hypothetical protein n=1 Tax=Mycolicibacterium sp. YH-1 TaxID=2908837 RepID=UPI001F4C1B83|nr:hypothetical protein [Mycolicibacterium sp. YH-1]UNB50124.1 hypothetical protein L0M16_19240 [Mycolicibacterium sp. YH-1]